MGSVAHTGKREMHTGLWWGNVKEGDFVWEMQALMGG
jgi:hypothetical protein